jgi:hypothetical protein
MRGKVFRSVYQESEVGQQNRFQSQVTSPEPR